jgi:hypothetical protein
VSTPDENSRRTRVVPIFEWLKAHGGDDWPQRLVDLADGIGAELRIGKPVSVEFEKEREVGASPERLAWMIKNAAGLIPRDGRLWRELRRRTVERPEHERAAAVARLQRGDIRIPRHFKLEGRTHADCFVDCEHAVLWIEGKRNDWLDPAIKWDSLRDQLARNLEAAWREAARDDKDFCLLICYERELKHHEQALIAGYRSLTWAGGLLHLSDDIRALLGARIGSVTWGTIVEQWPELRSLNVLRDVSRPRASN